MVDGYNIQQFALSFYTNSYCFWKTVIYKYMGWYSDAVKHRYRDYIKIAWMQLSESLFVCFVLQSINGAENVQLTATVTVCWYWKEINLLISY